MPPQKTTKGSKQKKKQEDTKKRELVTTDEDPCLEYAVVLKIFSTDRVDVRCHDGKTRQGVISGSMRKKIFVAPGDLVLVAKRDYQDAKCDISLKYFPFEVQLLVKKGHIESNFCNIEENSKKGKAIDDEGIFDSGDDEDEEEKKKEKEDKHDPYRMPSSSDDEDDKEEEKEEEVINYNKKPVAKDKRLLEQKKEDSGDDDLDIDDI